MNSQIIEDQLKLTGNFQKFCRLCLSEEMLEDVFKFKQDDIIRQISDLLSIEISEDDQISRSICAICRARLYEFRDYKLSCLEVQDVLRVRSQIKSELQDDLDTEEDLLVEMKISPENTEHDAETFGTGYIETSVTNPFVQQKNLPKPKHKRNIYEVKKNYMSCTKCRKKVPKSCIQAHMDKHRLQTYKCERGCLRTKFECRQTQLQHYVDVHKDRPRKCKVCHKLFTAKSSLLYHTQSVHQLKRYRCEICNSLYPTAYLLDRHMKIHSAKMDYNCAICGYATTLKYNINRHILMHERKEKEKKQVRARTSNSK